MTQLGFDFAPPARTYTCCGQPCPPLPPAMTDPAYVHQPPQPFPHTADCPNPNVGTWIDRATGWPIRQLRCTDTEPCPHGGTYPQRPGTADPYNGRCCLQITATAAK